MSIPPPTASDQPILDRLVRELYNPHSGETAKSITEKLRHESGRRFTTRMVTHRAHVLGLRMRNPYSARGTKELSQNAGYNRQPRVIPYRSSRVNSDQSTPTAQSNQMLRAPVRPPPVSSLPEQGSRLWQSISSPWSSQSSHSGSIRSFSSESEDPFTPVRPLSTPSEMRGPRNALREWDYFLHNNHQLFGRVSFAPMSFVNDYFVWENLTQALRGSEAWASICQIPSRIKSMLQCHNISLALSFIFMRQLAECNDLTARFRRRVAQLLQLILESASQMYSRVHPMFLILSEIYSQGTHTVQSMDKHIFEVVIGSIRCAHHREELRLIMATHAMWDNRLQEAKDILNDLTFETSMPPESPVANFKDKVNLFVNVSAQQNLAVIWMREGKLERSEGLLRHLVERTESYPLLQLSAASRLCKTLYARDMLDEAESMLHQALKATDKLPNECQRVSFKVDFESQLGNLRTSNTASSQESTVWHYYLSGIQSSRFEDSMGSSISH